MRQVRGDVARGGDWAGVYAAGAERVAQLGSDARLPPPIRLLLVRFAHAAAVAWAPAAAAAAAAEAGVGGGEDEGLLAGRAVLELRRAGMEVFGERGVGGWWG